LSKETDAQRNIRQAREELMQAVSRKNKALVARAAAKLYQLTHPPPPPPLPKVKHESKTVGRLNDEDDLPLSELMKSHSAPVKVKQEEQDADSAAVVSGKKRKRVSKQQQPHSPNTDNDAKGAAGHDASGTRKVRHSGAHCHDAFVVARSLRMSLLCSFMLSPIASANDASMPRHCKSDGRWRWLKVNWVTKATKMTMPLLLSRPAHLVVHHVAQLLRRCRSYTRNPQQADAAAVAT
jgi:hypothetical protein